MDTTQKKRIKRLTEEDIKDINKKVVSSWDSGIFIQPNYIPTDIKDHVCFMRWNSESRGGSCWDDADTVHEIQYNDKPEFEALKLALNEIGCNDDQKYHIENYLIQTNDDAGSYVGYYGDYDDYKAEWVRLEDIINI